MNQDKPALQRASYNAQAYQRMSKRETHSSFTFSYSRSFAALVAGASRILSLLDRTLPSSNEMPFPELAYAASNLYPMATDFPKQMDISNPSLAAIAPAPPLSTQPPLINDDPTLEEIAYQAQTGLFALLGREKSS